MKRRSVKGLEIFEVAGWTCAAREGLCACADVAAADLAGILHAVSVHVEEHRVADRGDRGHGVFHGWIARIAANGFPESAAEPTAGNDGRPDAAGPFAVEIAIEIIDQTLQHHRFKR